MDQSQREYVDWVNSLLRPGGNLAQGLEELAKLKKENEQLWEIVKVLAEDDPYTYNDNNGKMECVFCYDSWGWASNEKHTKDHEPDCLITKARALVANITQEGGE